MSAAPVTPAGADQGVPGLDLDPLVGSSLFREEAVRHRLKSTHVAEENGLHASRVWERVTASLVVLVPASAGLLLTSVSLQVGESAKVVVRARGDVAALAPASSVAEGVDARPGDLVSSGQPLVRLRPAAGGAVIVVTAPTAGRLRQLRVAVGDHLARGEPLFVVSPPHATLTAVGTFPRDARPALAPGMRVPFVRNGHEGPIGELQVQHIESGTRPEAGPEPRPAAPEADARAPAAGTITVRGRLLGGPEALSTLPDGAEGSITFGRKEPLAWVLFPRLRRWLSPGSAGR